MIKKDSMNERRKICIEIESYKKYSEKEKEMCVSREKEIQTIAKRDRIDKKKNRERERVRETKY